MFISKKKGNKIYLEIYNLIREKIISGEIKEGKSLPSLRNLAEDLDVSVNSVNHAYKLLESEGYIEGKERRAYKVLPLDYTLQMDLKKVKEEEEKDKRPSLNYDFSFQGVDSSAFPYSIWRKMYKESIDDEDEDLLKIGPRQGSYSLRKSIALYLRESRNIRVSPDDIVISSGTEAIFSLLKTLLPEKTIFGFEDPGYPWGAGYFTYQTENYRPIPIDEEGILVDHLDHEGVNLALVTPAHQFPMGYIMSNKRRKDLLSWAHKEKGRYIIEDDYDGELHFSGPAKPALKSWDKEDRVIYIGSFSKLISPSLRISFFILPKELMKIYKREMKGLTCPVSMFNQRALENFISQSYFEKHINRMKNLYRKKHKLVAEKLDEIDNIEILNNSNPTTFVIKIKGVNDREVFLERAKSKGLGLVSLDRYQYKKEGEDLVLLLGFCSIEITKIEDGLDLLKEIIEEG